ncbi:hypothetical protein pb186bvf_001011 [Paramecium bursaria]
MDTEEIPHKVLFVGDTEVGKTHLVSLFLKDKLPEMAEPSRGLEFSVKAVKLKNGNIIKLQLWDISGSERYRDSAKEHFKKAVGAVLVFDLTKSPTFENINKWIKDVRDQASPQIVIILVGNKLDLVQNDPQARQVETEIAMNYAKEQNIKYFESSTFTRESIQEIFETLVIGIMQIKFLDINKEKEIKQ